MERMSVFVIALVLVTWAFTASESVSLPDPVLASVTWNNRDGFGIVQGLAEDDDKVVARGNFTNRYVAVKREKSKTSVARKQISTKTADSLFPPFPA